jgi:hypothetical protein
LVGVTVKVTEVPAQMIVAVAVILADGMSNGETLTVIELEVTVVGEAQGAVEVITTVITSPFTRLLLE